MEAVTLEYTCLLTNQLDDQRRYGSLRGERIL